MEEQLISFETAKLAEEKEFNIMTQDFYYDDGELGNFYSCQCNDRDVNECSRGSEELYSLRNEFISAPTQSLLQKWLREVHGIDITIRPNGLGKYDYQILFESNYSEPFRIYNTYEEALEIGLQEALKLIKSKEDETLLFL